MSRIYKSIIGIVDPLVPKGLRPVWEHPAGPKTVFFWAPAFKWGLVIAGINDLLYRPADKLSAPQCTSLALTGYIWSRYSLVIIPVNYTLFSVNIFLAVVQTVQLVRAIRYQQSLSVK